MAEQKLITETQCNFDFVDRIKILFGAIVHVEVQIWIPTEVDRYNGHSNIKLIGKSKSSFKQDKPEYGYSAPQPDKDE